MTYENLFIISLSITILLELFILALYKIFFKKKISFQNIFFIAFLPSSLTLPYLWFIFSQYGKGGYIGGEFGVFLVEGLILYKIFNFSFRQAFALSFVMNLFSYLIGKKILLIIMS